MPGTSKTVDSRESFRGIDHSSIEMNKLEYGRTGLVEVLRAHNLLVRGQRKNL